MVRIAIDIGGTFTDVVGHSGGKFDSAKVLTQSARPEESALEGLKRLLQKMSLTAADITGIVHGTTLATNALIERRGARTAFVTTEGFRDVLEMRYEKRFDQYALDIEFPEPLIPRPLRLTLPERTLADGSISKAPELEDIENLATTLQQQAVESVAIGFLHSYKNPDNELQVAESLRQLLNHDVTICTSADVAGEIREYERFSTVCANAYVRPLISTYLQKLLQQLSALGFDGSFLMMLSDGSLTTLDKAMRFPIRLVEGGPAGGVALGAQVANQISCDKLLSLDIGGTTAKICFIEDATPRTARRFEIARAWRDVKGSGLPVRVPTVELVEIGAGGGSIAHIDRLQRLRVGPRSAGAAPGPAAYGLGGTDATLTDAHIELGHITAEGFAEGMIALDTKLAHTAIADNVQRPLGFDKCAEAAAGVVELADETLANAARVHAVEQGLDITSFDLLVSGGGGGLHGARIAEKLGMRRVIVPDNAGVGSAVGFLHSPVAYEIGISVLEPLSEISPEILTERLRHAQKTVTDIVAEAVVGGKVDTEVQAELRYRGQGLELTFTLDDSEGYVSALEKLEADFKHQYLHLNGFVLDNIPIELVALSVKATEQREQTTENTSRTNSKAAKNTMDPLGNRTVFSVKDHCVVDYVEVHRESVADDKQLNGPLVVPEAQTTTLVPPGWTLQRLHGGHLLLSRV